MVIVGSDAVYMYMLLYMLMEIKVRFMFEPIKWLMYRLVVKKFALGLLVLRWGSQLSMSANKICIYTYTYTYTTTYIKNSISSGWFYCLIFNATRGNKNICRLCITWLMVVNPLCPFICMFACRTTNFHHENHKSIISNVITPLRVCMCVCVCAGI